jgi:hypothetical protein
MCGIGLSFSRDLPPSLLLCVQLVDAPVAAVGTRAKEQPTKMQVGADGAGSAAVKPRAADAQQPAPSDVTPREVGGSGDAAAAPHTPPVSDADADLFARFSALGK